MRRFRLFDKFPCACYYTQHDSIHKLTTMEARMQRILLTLIFLILTANAAVFGDVYRIREGDTLLIAVIGQPEYTQTVQVREDGMMSYFSGDLHVAGKTADAVGQRIRAFLVSENLVSNPVIMVSPVPQENGIFVGGAVKTPGRYVISPKTDIGLYRAITLAGGVAENADVQQVQLIRATVPLGTAHTEGKVETYDISINQPYRDVRVNVRDLVFVMPLSVVEVQGQVQVPGKLFIRGNISIAEALARAGGLTAEAALGALVKVSRDGTLSEFSVTEQFWKSTANGKATIETGQALLLSDGLSDGDVLFVPNAFKVEPIYVIGYVRNPGAHRVREPLTLAQAVALAGGFEEAADRKNVTIHRHYGTSFEHPFTASSGTEVIFLHPGDILEVDKRFQLSLGLVSAIVSTASVITTLIVTLTR